MRIRTSTGLIEGSPIPVGASPSALAYDGTFMYVANSGDNSVTRINASTGMVDGGPIGVGTNPVALAFDGTFLYVANSGSNSVTRIRVSSGAVEGSPISAPGMRPHSLVFAGTFIYLSNRGDELGGTGNIMRINAATGAVAGTTTNVVEGALAFDGTFVYVANGAFIVRLRATTGVRDPDPIASGDGDNVAICFDGTSLYVSGDGVPAETIGNDYSVIKTNINGLGVESKIPAKTYGHGVRALAFDGTYIYAAVERIFIDGGGTQTTLNGFVMRFQ